MKFRESKCCRLKYLFRIDQYGNGFGFVYVYFPYSMEPNKRNKINRLSKFGKLILKLAHLKQLELNETM